MRVEMKESKRAGVQRVTRAKKSRKNKMVGG